VSDCPVCGLAEQDEHLECEDAQQVEPYEPWVGTRSEWERATETLEALWWWWRRGVNPWA
jgi:hypothetical protein